MTTRPISWLDYDIDIVKNSVGIEAYLLAAYAHASVHSPDPSTQLGAVLVAKRQEKEATLLGHNAPSRGLNLTPEQLNDRSLKMLVTLHAEESALLSAASAGFQCRGATLVCPWYSCPECAKAIVAARISRVIGHLQMFQLTPDRWKPSIDAGFRILHAGGVKTSLYDGPIGPGDETGVSIRFNGVPFQPGRCGLEIVTGV